MRWTYFLLLPFVIGCAEAPPKSGPSGGNSANANSVTPTGDLTEDDARDAWAATLDAIQGDSEPGDGGTTNEDGSVSVPCTQGGTLTWTARDLEGVSFEYALDFAACTESDTVITGPLVYGFEVVEEADSPSSTKWTYVGNLIYGGAVVGACGVDTTSSVRAEDSGVQLDATGEICGYAAEQVTAREL